MAETHLGDALNALFYQPSRWAHHGKASIPQRWAGLPEAMAPLTELVKDEPLPLVSCPYSGTIKPTVSASHADTKQRHLQVAQTQ